MIEFLTLFAGLVLGVQNVEVAVSGPAARVELRVNDDVLAGTRARTPITSRCSSTSG